METCSICLHEFTDPVRLETGHVYDRECITAWFRSRPPPYVCPLSNVQLDTTALFPVTRGFALGARCTLPPPPPLEVLVWAPSAPPLASFAQPQPARAPPARLPPLSPPPPTRRRRPPALRDDDDDDARGSKETRRACAFSWGVLQLTMIITTACVAPRTLKQPDDALPIYNVGRHYVAQPWRPLSALLTYTNAPIAVASMAVQVR
jgi:RING-type zinc-finger